MFPSQLGYVPLNNITIAMLEHDTLSWPLWSESHLMVSAKYRTKKLFENTKISEMHEWIKCDLISNGDFKPGFAKPSQDKIRISFSTVIRFKILLGPSSILYLKETKMIWFCHWLPGIATPWLGSSFDWRTNLIVKRVNPRGGLYHVRRSFGSNTCHISIVHSYDHLMVALCRTL